jgi:Protein of unknown function (DUF2384)
LLFLSFCGKKYREICLWVAHLAMNKIAPLPLERVSKGAVLTKAAVRAGQRLKLPNKVLGKIIGLSESTISRMGTGDYVLPETAKAFELAALFIRFYRSLDAIVGGDDSVSQKWLNAPNTGLDGVPVERIQSVQGLIDVIQYLDARRALV